MFHLIIVLVISPILISTCSASYCPNAQDLYPCTCGSDSTNSTIICNASQQFNLTSIFSKVSKDARAVEQIFAHLSIVSDKLVEIPENAFGKIKFNSILISEYCKLLKRIHPKAFSYQSNITRELFIEARNVIPDKSSPNSFYDLVNSFENLEQLTYHSTIGTLKEKFNKNLNNLTHLSLRIGEIQGSPFSNMSKIKILNLFNGGLNYISKNALKFRNSNGSLRIDLSYNQLNSSSFENGLLTDTSLKKVEVTLSLEGNLINYLDETVFMPFLTNRIGNVFNNINLFDNPLDCDDCRSAWICKSKKSDQIRQAIIAKTCNDGRFFNDCSSSFLKCK